MAAPKTMSIESIRLAVVARLSWINKRVGEFQAQSRESAREYVSGESIHFFGKRYRLDLIETSSRPVVRVKNNRFIELRVQPGTDGSRRAEIVNAWYRKNLYEYLREIRSKWEARTGVAAGEIRVRKMKTKWGSCSRGSRRIWLNLELAKKPHRCVEYILAHELIHLVERHHNERFLHLMDGAMPDWRVRKDELNSAPLAHEEWDY